MFVYIIQSDFKEDSDKLPDPVRAHLIQRVFSSMKDAESTCTILNVQYEREIKAIRDLHDGYEGHIPYTDEDELFWSANERACKLHDLYPCYIKEYELE